MAISEKQAISVEELLSNIHSKKEEKEHKTVNNLRQMSKNFPIGTILFVLLIAALGVMVIMLKAEVVSLKTEIADLRNPKAQIAESEQKIRIAVIEDKIEESDKEKQLLKAELLQIKNHIEDLKNMKTDKKKFIQR
jgi:ABC-type Na+ efflux pump permease subunit